ncbi:MAG TPA: hypothetical protein VGF17_28625 [Phytomonospora sp.]|nr:hypothetical protein [Thermoleophilia bacterium]
MRRRRLAALTAASGVAAALVAATVAWAAPSSGQVVMLDACDPASFNAVLGDGACERPGGGVTIDAFVGQLLKHGTAPAWRFAGPVTVATGGTLTAVNKGGEFHTFTEVAAFGGGCVDELNTLLGLTPVPECAQAPGIFFATGAPRGGSTTTGALAAGTHRFMCLIHPWMRTTVTAK